MVLPSPQQSWQHSCCSEELLESALKDDSIFSIEADILMGTHVKNNISNEHVPIMAHPPSKTSDLSFEEFIEACAEDGQVNVKLDFKELEAIEKCMPVVAKYFDTFSKNNRTVYLNADILPGPGINTDGMKAKAESSWINADRFINLCREHCPDAALSLGWKMTLPTSIPYTYEQMDDMIAVLDKHGISGDLVVFAVNARCVHLDVKPVQYLLENVENSQALLWTAHGEPPISSRLKNSLSNSDQFDPARVGFDVQVAKNEFVGNFYDVAMYLYGAWLYYFPKE